MDLPIRTIESINCYFVLLSLTTITANGFGYEQLRGLVRTFASTRQAKNPRGFSEGSKKSNYLQPLLCVGFYQLLVTHFKAKPLTSLKWSIQSFLPDSSVFVSIKKWSQFGYTL